MGPYKSPYLTDDVVQSTAFQSIFDTPVNQFTGLNTGYIKDARDNRPDPVVEGEDGEMYAQDSTFTLDGWETEQTGDTPLYYYANSQELGDVYEGNYFNRQDNGNISVQGRYVTEDEIRDEFNADQGMGYFKEANPDLDEDTYVSFIKDNSKLVSQGLNRDENPDPFNALADQYGITTSFQNNDGDMFEFNGSNFTKTFKTPEADYGRMLYGAALGAVLAPVATQAAAGMLGNAGTAIPIAANTNPLLASAATTAGTAAPSGLAMAAGAGVSSAASQALLTGSIDPKSVLINAVLGGANPGQYVAENFVPQQGTQVGMTLGGTSPGNFVNGFVEGSVNAGLSDVVQNGSLDLKSAGLSGLIEGGSNVIKDTLADYKHYSPEAAEARYLIDHPTASVEEAKDYVAKLLEGDLIEESTTQLLNRTNLGALIGEGGLLPFIPELNVAPIRDGLGMLANATDTIVNGVDLGDIVQMPDGTVMPASDFTVDEIEYLRNNHGAQTGTKYIPGIANNPLVNTVTQEIDKGKKLINTAVGKISNFLAGNSAAIQNAKDVSETESKQMKAYKDLLYETIDMDVDIENPDMDTRAKVAATKTAEEMKVFRDRAKAILSYTEQNGDPFWHGNYGLDEKYNFNDNPRGDTEVKGTAGNLDTQWMTGDDLYSVGADLSGTRQVPQKPTPPGINPLIFNLDDQKFDDIVLPAAGSAADGLLENAVEDILKTYISGTTLPSDKGEIATISTTSKGNAQDAVVNSTIIKPQDDVINPITKLPTSGGATITLPQSTISQNPRSGDPVLWTDLVWRDNNIGYKGKGDRARAYDKNMGMLKQALAGEALGVNFNLPKGLTDKELFEAGKLT